MKIGFLSILYGEENRKTGGVRSLISCVSEELARKGHEVTIITCGRNRSYTTDNNIRIIELNKVDIIGSLKELFRPTFVFKRLLYMLKANLAVRKEKFDILETFDGGFEYLFLTFFKPCFISVGTHSNFSHHVLWPRISKIINRIEAFSAKRCNLINSPSRGYAGIISKGYKIPVSKIRIIPNGIDLGRILDFKCRDVRSRYKIGGKKIVLFVGEMTRRKGIDVFVSVARRYEKYKNVIFVAIGKDTEFAKTLKTGENTLFPGVIKNDELFSFYKECEIVLLPTNMEAFGLSILEAFAFGKPVVTSRIPGVSDIARDRHNALLCKQGDLEDYCGKVEFLLKRKTLKDEYGRNAFDTAKKFDISKVTEERIGLYEDLLSNRKGQRL